MAHPGHQQQEQQRRRRGVHLLLLLAALLLFSLCLLARVDAAAATTVSAAANFEWEDGAVATALAGQEAAVTEEGERPERVEMEAINDYVPFGANNRHNPNPHP